MIRAVSQLFDTTDYALLQKQKEDLFSLLSNPLLSGGEKDSLEGVLSLLDTFQDAAVAFGIPEERVYPGLYQIE